MVKNKLVLRSLNVPQYLDEALRVIAFHERSSKSDVIKRLLEQGVEQYRPKLDGWAPRLLPPTQLGSNTAKERCPHKEPKCPSSVHCSIRPSKDRIDICAAQSPGDPDSDDEDGLPVTCSCEPGHEGLHMGGVRCGTVTWVDSENWE